MNLSKKEEQVLDELLTAVPSVVALRNGVTENRIANIKTRARRKEADAEKFLRKMKKYQGILHPKKRYKGI